MTNNEQILGETNFQIISEEELQNIQEITQKQNIDTINHTINSNDDENILNILKETGIYDELDNDTKQKLDQI